MTAAASASAPATARHNGVLLLVGAAVLLVLVAVSAGLLRALWRLHGEWYGGKPA